MLGHKLVQRLQGRFDVVATVRSEKNLLVLQEHSGNAQLISGVIAEDIETVKRVCREVRPALIVNCIGIVKQLKDAKKPLPSITVNALFPHQLAGFASQAGMRLVHFSTDCVFSGATGNYVEDDLADAEDLYGRTKFLGEVGESHCVTIRSSIIGHELRSHASLIDWLVSQRGKRVSGFARAQYSGLSTLAMADVVTQIACDWPDLSGVWQVSSDPISKFDLLTLVNRVYDLGIEIDRDKEFACDRRLDSSRFRHQTGWRPPSWEQMVIDMHADYLACESR
jgi:dTDP-4-dehydrorhamnose reductase